MTQDVMSEFIQITTTTGKRKDADQIAAELVSRRLAACVQVSGPVVSTFRWQGNVETAEEYVCVIKTRRTKFEAVRDVVRELHPYEVPEIVATPIIEGNVAYLKWLAEQVGE